MNVSEMMQNFQALMTQVQDLEKIKAGRARMEKLAAIISQRIDTLDTDLKTVFGSSGDCVNDIQKAITEMAAILAGEFPEECGVHMHRQRRTRSDKGVKRGKKRPVEVIEDEDDGDYIDEGEDMEEKKPRKPKDSNDEYIDDDKFDD